MQTHLRIHKSWSYFVGRASLVAICKESRHASAQAPVCFPGAPGIPGPHGVLIGYTRYFKYLPSISAILMSSAPFLRLVRAGLATLLLGMVAETAILAAPPPGDSASDAGPGTYEFVISSGLGGGGYFAVAKRLATVLDRNGSRSQLLASQGSIENLKRLTSAGDPTNIALAQADALTAFLADAPQHQESTAIIDAWGEECLFAIVPAQSDLKSDRDFRNREVNIAVAGPDSGPAATVRYLKQGKSKLSGVSLHYMAPEEALSRMTSPGGGDKIDALLLVQHPKARPPVMNAVLDDMDRYRFLTIRGLGRAATLPNGKLVYRRAEITPTPRSGIAVKTVCTKRLLLGSKSKLGEGRLDALTTLVKQHWRDIYVRPTDTPSR